MNNLNNIKDSFCEENACKEEDHKTNKMNSKLEKILCNHCGRTTSNGIRCLGICVADSDY